MIVEVISTLRKYTTMLQRKKNNYETRPSFLILSTLAMFWPLSRCSFRQRIEAATPCTA